MRLPRQTMVCLSFLALLLVFSTSSAQILKTFSSDFTRIANEGGAIDSSTGTVFYREPGEIFLEVKTPIHQTFFLRENLMVLLYPEKKLALKYTSKTPFSLPFLQAFLGVLEGERGFQRMGWVLKSSQPNESGETSLWNPPGNSKESSVHSLEVLKDLDNRIVQIISRSPKNKIDKRVRYQNYLQIRGAFLPQEISTLEGEGKKSIQETFLLRKIALDPVLPPGIQSWAIPSDFQVKEYSW